MGNLRLVTHKRSRQIKISAPTVALQNCEPFRLDQIYRSILLFIHGSSLVVVAEGMIMAY
nr:MAG TPA: hypothetical protein [Caudoviricetes sp.]